MESNQPMLDVEAMYAIFDAAVDSMIIIDEFGEIQALNRATVDAFGYGDASELVGRNVSMLMGDEDADRHDGYIAHYRNTGERRIIGTGRLVVGRRKDGTEIPLHLSVSEFWTNGRRMFAGICHQDAAYKEFTERLGWMATHDQLTGVLNRHGLDERLGEAVRAAGERGNQVAVLVLDLSKFKQINDGYGHAVGDEVLAQAVQRITGQLRRDDAVARLGGDEFVVVLHPGSQHLSEDCAYRIDQAMRLPFVIDEHVIMTGATIGISLFPDHGSTAEELLSRADLAMYRAKATGATARTYDSLIHAQDEAERHLITELREAIDADQLVLHYQPQFDLTSLETVGVEALVRWQHPERGLLMAGQFVQLAIRNGLATNLSRWVLRRACADNARLIRSGRLDVPVAVNVDATVFSDPAFLPLVRDTLANAGLPARRLEIEVVEDIAMAVSPQTSANATGLAELGVRLAMDDFGTGYSSLQQLNDQQFNKLKIDRAFVGRLPWSTRDRTIVNATLELARGLSMTSVAEGIETSEQRDVLLDLGCDQGQGFWYARPMPLEALADWLAEGLEHAQR